MVSKCEIVDRAIESGSLAARPAAAVQVVNFHVVCGSDEENAPPQDSKRLPISMR